MTMLETVYLLVPIIIIPLCLIAALAIVALEAWGAIKRKRENRSPQNVAKVIPIRATAPDSAIAGKIRRQTQQKSA